MTILQTWSRKKSVIESHLSTNLNGVGEHSTQTVSTNAPRQQHVWCCQIEKWEDNWEV